MATVNTGWLVNENQDKFAPKTLVSQVIDNNGQSLEDILNNSVSDRIYDCDTNREDPVKIIYGGISQKLVEGTELLIRFTRGCYTSSSIMYLDFSMERKFPVYYQGRNYGIILKENVIYTFRFNDSGSGYFEIIGDVDTEYNLLSFGISATANEINCVKGATENIPEQINKLKKSKVNPNNTDAYKISKDSDKNMYTEPGTGYTYLCFEPNEILYDGTVIITGYSGGSKYNGIWLKINNVEVFKVQNEEDGNKTQFFKFAYKVNAGDRISGNSTGTTTLTYYPNM